MKDPLKGYWRWLAFLSCLLLIGNHLNITTKIPIGKTSSGQVKPDCGLSEIQTVNWSDGSKECFCTIVDDGRWVTRYVDCE